MKNILKKAKIGQKLYFSFGTLTLILIFLSILSVIALSNIGNILIEITDNNFQKTIWANNISNQISLVEKEIRNIILYDDLKHKQDAESTIVNSTKIVDGELEKLKNNIKLEKEKEIFKNITEKRLVYSIIQKHIISIALSGDTNNAKDLLYKELSQKQSEYMKFLDEMIGFQTKLINDEGEYGHILYIIISIILIISSILAVAFSIILSLFITRSITNPLEKCVTIAEEVAQGNTDIEINITSMDETGKLLGSLKKMVNSIKNLITDADMLTQAAINGNLSTRVDSDKHHGSYKLIIDGFNGTLDALTGPLNLAAEYIDRISKGNIPPKIVDDYKGDFNEIKTNLNICIEELNTLTYEMARIYYMQQEGDIEAFIDENKFHGAYQTIIESYNNGLKMHINNILGMLDLIREYSEGDLSKEMPKLPGKQIPDSNALCC